MAMIPLKYWPMLREPKLRYDKCFLAHQNLSYLKSQVKKNFPELVRTAYAKGEIELDDVGLIQTASVFASKGRPKQLQSSYRARCHVRCGC